MQQGHPIAFISKALSHKKALMPVYDRELLAIGHAVVADALSRITGAELLAMVVFPQTSEMLHSIIDSWNQDQEVKKLIEELQADSNKHPRFTWSHMQLRRKGVEATLKRLQTLFYWKDLRKDVKAYILGYDVCQKNKDDIVKGYEVIMVVVDKLSKYAHFLALKHPYTAQTVARAFSDNIVKLHGFPEAITSDRDTYWYNTNYHSGIHTTPFEAIYGRPPPIHLPYILGESAASEVDSILTTKEFKLQVLKHHLSRAQLRMKNQADKHKSDRSFQVGDWVYLNVHPYIQTTISSQPYHKLASKLPFQVTKRIGSVAYTLLLPATVQIHPIVHVSLLKKFHVIPDHISYPPVLVLQGRMVKKGNKAVAQVLVKWQGIPADDATWEYYNELKIRFPHFDP
ncbi:hypothetical protein A4A49_52345 [Nicotiana attenuata]|uniref:Chromo domain-containing protein n=1 Tax=Nicotiana attenuata TaxID=49451 RepID=A0A1J6JPT1_NICAT|nr:hypothetical protein A4A49_52345 [Nicotiana attenuata]